MSVLSLLDRMSLNYRLVDNEAVARCPYHNDGHPSFSVNTDSGVWHCFSCGAKGNLAKLIADLLGYPYAEAVIATNEAVGSAKMGKWKEEHDSISLSPMAVKVTEADMALFIEPPVEALESRNISSHSAHHYGVKWNPVNNTWIFPYRDPFSGELWGWQEKNARIFRNFPAGTKKSKTLFGYQQLYAGGTAILLESPVDCAVMLDAGYLGSVASFGVLTGTYQLALLQYKRTNTLIVALDNDTAGVKATIEMLPEAIKMFRYVRVFNYFRNRYKDPGDMNYDAIGTGMEEALPAIEWMRKHV